MQPEREGYGAKSDGVPAESLGRFYPERTDNLPILGGEDELRRKWSHINECRMDEPYRIRSQQHGAVCGLLARPARTGDRT